MRLDLVRWVPARADQRAHARAWRLRALSDHGFRTVPTVRIFIRRIKLSPRTKLGHPILPVLL